MNAGSTTKPLPRTPELIAQAYAAMSDQDAKRVQAGFAAAAARPVTLRANALKTTPGEVAEKLTERGIPFERVPWYEDAFVLGDGVREKTVWELELYQEGKVYLQSLSSMLPPLALAARDGADVLDMCAAPGGKTSQIAALTGGTAHITACEMSAPRAEKLTYNLSKLGVHGVNIMRTDARRLDEFFSFDHILLDAPCTGTGTFRLGDDRAGNRMTGKLLAKTARSQRALLDRALTVLKPGGTLLYSTCSILPQENDEQVAAALRRHRDCSIVPLVAQQAAIADDDAEPLPASTRALAGAFEDGSIPTLKSAVEGTVTVCPSQRFEGFYLALIKKQ